ncbi:MAG: hypothetical protein ACP5GX_08470 [Anaerolineae bacterium]
MLTKSKVTHLRWLVGLLVAALLLLGGCNMAKKTPTPDPRTPTPTITPINTATSVPSPSSTPTAGATSTPRPTATPTPTPLPPTPTPSLEELAAQYPEIAAILNNPEVHGVYKELLVVYEQGGEQAALNYARQRGLVSGDGQIMATLVLDTEDTASTVAQLQSMGVTVLGVSGNRISIAIPQETIMASGGQPGVILNQLSGLEHVTGVLPPG